MPPSQVYTSQKLPPRNRRLIPEVVNSQIGVKGRFLLPSAVLGNRLCFSQNPFERGDIPRIEETLLIERNTHFIVDMPLYGVPGGLIQMHRRTEHEHTREGPSVAIQDTPLHKG